MTALRKCLLAGWSLVAAIALVALPLSAQTIGVSAGSTPAVQVLPNAKVTVPVIIDLTNASATNIASLAAGISWGTARLTFDSLRVVGAVGWSFTPNIAGAAGGSVSFTSSNGVALPATATLANAYFTASATTGGTRVALSPTAAANASLASILALLQPRALDVCVALSGTWGDVNSDGIVNIVDAQQLARASVSLSVLDANALSQRGDVNADGTPNIIDAQQIARFSVGLSTASPRINTSAFAAPVIASASMSPSTTQNLSTGGTVQLTVTPRDAGSADLTGCSSFAWGTTNAAVATVNASGFVTATGAGSATITATSLTNPGVTASVPIAVTGTGPPTIHVAITHTGTPARQYIAQVSGGALPDLQGFTLNGTSMNSGAIDMVMPGAGTYQVRVVAIDAGSDVNAPSVVAGGQFSIVMPANGTVSQPIALTAPAYTVNTIPTTVNTGVPIVVAWTIVDPAGLIDGPGRASPNLFCGEVVVNMTTLTPDVFGGTGTNACSVTNSVPGTMTFSNSASPVAAQSTPGALRVQMYGINKVRGGTGTGSDVFVLYINPSVSRGQTPLSITIATPITTVTVAPALPSLPVGLTQQMTATARDASNTIVTGFPVTWSSGTPSVATISPTGLVTAIANGTTVITGTVTGVSGTTTVTVSGGINVGSITVAALPALSGNNIETAVATVRDPMNNVIAGAAVTWSSSNAMIARVAADGTVQALGSGSTNITATIGGVHGQAALTVSTVSPQFNITFVPLTTMSPAASAAFASAAARWMTIIRSHDPDVANVDASGCLNQPAGTTVPGTVNGVVIYGSVVHIDGVGGILGQAGPCLVRSGNGHAIVGTMEFDEDDIANMQSNGTLNSVILHEMAHVLGFGTNWGALLANPATFVTDPQGDPTFVGVNAQWAMQNLGTGYGGAVVPVENCCGAGTRNSHWRETILQRELMTGFVTSSGINPLSPLTAAQFIDLGYVVDVSQSDQPPLPWFLRAGAQFPEKLIEIKEGTVPPPKVVDLNGRVMKGALLTPLRAPPKK